MANTFKIDTKSSCVTDAHTSTNVAEPPADSTFVFVLLTASVTTSDFVSILKVFAILS